jgi:hypothetical protein
MSWRDCNIAPNAPANPEEDRKTSYEYPLRCTLQHALSGASLPEDIIIDICTAYKVAAQVVSDIALQYTSNETFGRQLPPSWVHKKGEDGDGNGNSAGGGGDSSGDQNGDSHDQNGGGGDYEPPRTAYQFGSKFPFTVMALAKGLGDDPGPFPKDCEGVLCKEPNRHDPTTGPSPAAKIAADWWAQNSHLMHRSSLSSASEDFGDDTSTLVAEKTSSSCTSGALGQLVQPVNKNSSKTAPKPRTR